MVTVSLRGVVQGLLDAAPPIDMPLVPVVRVDVALALVPVPVITVDVTLPLLVPVSAVRVVFLPLAVLVLVVTAPARR